MNPCRRRASGCHTIPKTRPQGQQTGPKKERKVTRGREVIPGGCQRAAREATEASRSPQEHPSDLLRYVWRRKGSGHGPEGVQKEVQIGAPEEQQNRALAAARAQSSMSKDSPNEASKLGCSLKAWKRSLQSPRKHCKRPSCHQNEPCPAMGEAGQHKCPSPRLSIL